MRTTLTWPRSLCHRALLLLVVCSTQTASAQPSFTPNRKVELPGERLVLVTHASSTWDTRERSRPGLETLLKDVRGAQLPVVYLQASNDPTTYFTGDARPTFRVASSGGAFSFDFAARHVILAGGHLELCQLETATSVARRWSERPAQEDLRLTVITDATYLRGAYGLVRRKDAFFRPYLALRKRLGTKRIALSELLALAGPGQPALELARRYADLLSSELPGTHAVVAVVDGQQVTVRAGRVGAPTITLELMSSKAFAASLAPARSGLAGSLRNP